MDAYALYIRDIRNCGRLPQKLFDLLRKHVKAVEDDLPISEAIGKHNTIVQIIRAGTGANPIFSDGVNTRMRVVNPSGYEDIVIPGKDYAMFEDMAGYMLSNRKTTEDRFSVRGLCNLFGGDWNKVTKYGFQIMRRFLWRDPSVKNFRLVGDQFVINYEGGTNDGR